jgi:hypothetical protein
MKIRAYGSKAFAVINLRGVSTNNSIINISKFIKKLLGGLVGI